MGKSYRLENIRALLTEGFSPDELRAFCYDQPDFRTVYDQLAENTGKTQIIHRLIEYAERKELLDSLLSWAAKQNSATYKSNQPYSYASPAEDLAQQMRVWFETLGYRFESYNIQTQNHFEWIIDIPARRGYDRILVRGIAGEGRMSDFAALRRAVDEQKTDEGWLIAARRVSQAARDEADKAENRNQLFCYTFDELLDQSADFTGYLNWLEAEISSRGIDRMYVPLACTKEEFDPITGQNIGVSRYDERNGWIDGYIDRWLEDSTKEHISILGEFGTGKTWFALHYAWVALQRYRQAKERGIERPRLPLVIPLRDYAKAISVESLFSEFFFRKHEIPLSGYSAFEQLNRMGKLLLIFDGFDEMAERVDRQKMINNFWELAQVVVPGVKVILTCRTEHFPEAQEGRALLGAELKASTDKLTGEPPQFEVLELEKFNNDQIRQVLSFQAGRGTVERVMKNSELLDLARRPIMAELILEALPDIEAGKPIDLSRVYLYAVRRKMERDIKDERTFTSLADKLYFMCELSWEMLSTNRMSLNYREFPERLHRLFGSVVQEQKNLDHWHYDMMGQTMLIRNADGDYTPAHRSLLEFFAAYKIAAELGTLPSDFTELAQAQKHLDNSIAAQDYLWFKYFQRRLDEKGKIITISPLRRFSPESLENMVATVGQAPLTKAVLDLLVSMLEIVADTAKEALLDVIESTRGKTEAEVGNTGGNAATLLVRVDSSSFKGKDLSHTVLIGADFTNAGLNNSSLYQANLYRSIFQNTDLIDCNLQHANLQGAQFLGTKLLNADLRNADLTVARFGEIGAVRSVAFSPQGDLLAAATSLGLKIWKIDTQKLVLDTMAPHQSYLRDVQFAPVGDTIAAASQDGVISIWEAKNLKLLFVFPRLGKNEVHRIAYQPDGSQLATGCARDSIAIINLQSQKIKKMQDTHKAYVSCIAFTPDGAYLLSGSYDGTIMGWMVESGQKEFVITDYFGSAVNNIAFSPGGESFAVASHTENIAIYSFKTLKLHQELSTENFVWSVVYSSDGNMIAGTDNNQIVFWDAKTYSPLLKIEQAHKLPIRRLAFCPDCTLLASGSQDSIIKLWDARPFVRPSIETQINIVGYVPPNLSVITDDPATWPEWWQQGKITVPEGMVPNPDFGRCLLTIEQQLNCSRLRLTGAKGLEALAPDGRGTLGDWLAERGAIL